MPANRVCPQNSDPIPFSAPRSTDLPRNAGPRAKGNVVVIVPGGEMGSEPPRVGFAGAETVGRARRSTGPQGPDFALPCGGGRALQMGPGSIGRPTNPRGRKWPQGAQPYNTPQKRWLRHDLIHVPRYRSGRNPTTGGLHQGAGRRFYLLPRWTGRKVGGIDLEWGGRGSMSSLRSDCQNKLLTS